jgi:hypothetical protein
MLKSLDAIKQGLTWPPESQKDRLEQYAYNRRVFEGDHLSTYFQTLKNVGRLKALRKGDKQAVYFILNLPKRITLHWRDMLFYQAPVITAAASRKKEDAKSINETVEATKLIEEAAPEVLMDRSIFGSGVFRVSLRDGMAVIDAIPPEMWFPVVGSGHVRREEAHVIAWQFSRMETYFGNPNGSYERHYVYFEIHEPGRIRHRIFSYNPETKKLKQEQQLSDFEEYKDLAERTDGDGYEETDVDENLVVVVHGPRTSKDYYGLDDYKDLESLVSALESRLSHVDMILDKHSEPKMSGPPVKTKFNHATGQVETDIRGHYFPVEDKEYPEPKYITWDAQLAAAWQEVEKIIDLFYMMAETSPAAFGQTKDGAIESGAALRRLLISDVHRTGRDKVALGSAMTKVIYLAGELTGQTLEAKIHWFDGLPQDPLEEAQTEQILVINKLSDRLSSIMRVHNLVYEEDAQAIYDRIAEEDAEAVALMPGAGVGTFGNSRGSDDA